MGDKRHRRLSQLGFLVGAGVGALAYLAVERYEISLVAFVTVWYVVGYGLVRALTHPDHRRVWVIYIVLFPAVWILATALLWSLLGSAFGAVVLGAAIGLGVQALVTRFFMGTVRADQLHDLRHRLGIE